MPRPPRLLVRFGIYHVMAKGAVNQALFRDDDDRTRFLILLGQVVRSLDWSLLAYCLMTTHYHLLVRTPEADLHRGMQRLNGCYGQGFNRRHGQQGHVFYRRYHSLLVTREAHLLELFRYFAWNPVRAGACDKPADWPWSSYAGLVASDEAPPIVGADGALTFFGSDPTVARGRLREFVERSPVEDLRAFRHGV